MKQVGRDIPRLEVRAKVTGRAEYVHNLRLPGMLYGKVFRSTVPHGRIKSIDVSAARASIEPIGTMKLASRNTNSGSTSSTARHCSRRSLRRSAPSSPAAARRSGLSVAATVATTDHACPDAKFTSRPRR